MPSRFVDRYIGFSKLDVIIIIRIEFQNSLDQRIPATQGKTKQTSNATNAKTLDGHVSPKYDTLKAVKYHRPIEKFGYLQAQLASYLSL